jgi:hypothetical protein
VARTLRRTVTLCAGGLLLAAGVAMLVLPGPGLLVIPGGLAVLAREFEAPRRWQRALARRVRRGARD